MHRTIVLLTLITMSLVAVKFPSNIDVDTIKLIELKMDNALTYSEKGTIVIKVRNRRDREIYNLTARLVADPVYEKLIEECGFEYEEYSDTSAELKHGYVHCFEFPVSVTKNYNSDTSIAFKIVLSVENLFGKRLEKEIDYAVNIGPKTTIVKWFKKNDYPNYRRVTLGPDGTIYWHGNAYDSNGKLKWSSLGQTGAAIASDGTVYFATGQAPIGKGNRIYAYTPDGTKKWECEYASWFYDKYPASLRSKTDLALGPDGTIYFGVELNVRGGGSNQRLIMAFSPEGKRKWFFNWPGFGRIRGLAVGRDGTIYATTQDGYLLAVSSSGNLKWKFSRVAMEAEFATSPVIASDGTIYFGAFDTDGMDGGKYGATIYAFYPNGKHKWRYWYDDIVTDEMVIAPDGIIVVPLRNDGLLCINPDGTLNKTLKSDGIFAGPVIAADGTIYSITKYGYLHKHKPGSDSYKWYHFVNALYQDSSPLFEEAVSDPVIGKDGTIYLGFGHYLIAIIDDSPGPALEQWPRVGHDNSSTSRVGGK